jgi:hypothetical protein
MYRNVHTNINGCELVLEEAHYNVVLLSQHCKFMVVSFMYMNIEC